MPVISQHQTSTCGYQKSLSIYSKFSVEENKLTPSFQNPQEVAKKLQKPNNARKTQIYVFRGLRVNITKISYRVQFQSSHSKFAIANFIREGKDAARARPGTKFYK